MLRPATAAKRNSCTSMHAKQSSFHVFGELAFLAESMAA